MIKCLFIVTLFITATSYSQLTKQEASDYLKDNTRKDFTLLDQFTLAARSINPYCYIIPGKDSLLIAFDPPYPTNLTDSQLITQCESYYDGLSIVMNKDSMRYKYIGVTACRDLSRCCTAWFDMTTHDYKAGSSFEENLKRFLQANFYKCMLNTSGSYNGESTLILRYPIDSNSKYSNVVSIYSYYQSASALLADFISKSPPKIRRQYKELLFIFCINDRLEYFWRLAITDEQLSKLHKIKFYDSYVH